MSWRPQLNAVCGRCGKPRGLIHECVSNSRRRQTITPQLSFGTCPRCRKPYGGNPLAHVCAPKSDFRKRKAAHDKAERDQARKKRQQQAHDYTACTDGDCKRALCVAYKTGWKGGDEAGHDRGWEQGERAGYDRGFKEGYEKGFPEGIAACPRDHK
jgi:hypothetical protein